MAALTTGPRPPSVRGPPGPGPRRGRPRGRPPAAPASSGPGSASPRWGSSCSARPGPSAVAAADRRGLRGLRRPQAGTTSRPRSAEPPGCSGALGASLPDLARRRRRQHAAGRRGGPGRARREAGLAPPAALAVTILTSDAERPAAHPRQAGGGRRRGRLRRRRVRRRRTCARPSSWRPDCSPSCPGIRPPARPSTTRRGRPRPPRPSPPGADLLVIGPGRHRRARPGAAAGRRWPPSLAWPAPAP